MAGLIFGDIAGALSRFFGEVETIVIDAIKWLKQAILKLFDLIKSGLRQTVSYEKTLVRESFRVMSRHPQLLYGVTFALLFDYLDANG
ncbi:MAG: hypothetical protein QW743_08590 [Candidatus Methanomethylicia archaeon]|uniref:hypothetical protein n=1 Tax=Thermoprotei TaxID=183924 RepID=UPI00316689AA